MGPTLGNGLSASPGQRNLKKRIAYSSISHMGFIIIGIGSLSDMGLNSKSGKFYRFCGVLKQAKMRLKYSKMKIEPQV